MSAYVDSTPVLKVLLESRAIWIWQGIHYPDVYNCQVCNAHIGSDQHFSTKLHNVRLRIYNLHLAWVGGVVTGENNMFWQTTDHRMRMRREAWPPEWFRFVEAGNHLFGHFYCTECNKHANERHIASAKHQARLNQAPRDPDTNTPPAPHYTHGCDRACAPSPRGIPPKRAYCKLHS